MALRDGSRFGVSMQDVFPAGCHLLPDSIAEAMDYDEKTKTRRPAVDKVTGKRVWQCRVRAYTSCSGSSRPYPGHNHGALHARRDATDEGCKRTDGRGPVGPGVTQNCNRNCNHGPWSDSAPLPGVLGEGL
jgi:hypothetical protein